MTKRRDQRTYDVGSERTRGGLGANAWYVGLLVIVVVGAVLLALWFLERTSSRAEPHEQPNLDSSAVTTATVQPIDHSAHPSVTAHSPVAGSDARLIDEAPEGSEEAAEAFVQAWLEPEQKAREAALDAVAAPGLVEQLMLTSSDNIPDTAADGDPVLAEASTYSNEFVQTLEDGTKIRIYLVSDPEADHGWLATSVEEV